MLGPRWRERQGRPRDTEVPPEPANDLAPVSRPLYLPAAHDPLNEDVPDMRTLHLQPLPDWIRETFQQEFDSAGIEVAWGGDLDELSLRHLARNVDVLLTGRQCIEEELIAAVPDLRFIQVQGRAPWAVDWDAAVRAKVPVSVLPHRGAIAVAEQAMALMLGLCRELVAGHRGTSEAAYRELGTDPVVTSERKIAFNWLGFEDIRQLHGKILGLVGLGDIGLEVARRARAFDMEILYHKRSPLRATHEAAIGARYMTLEGLLAESDVVSLHAPHTPETEGMIDANTLARFKSSAILINTARGGLVDEAALVDALREGRLAGAGLDAFVEEPLPEGHALLDCPNVIFSPHVGGGTGGGQKGMIQAVVANLKRVEAGEAPHGLVEA